MADNLFGKPPRFSGDQPHRACRLARHDLCPVADAGKDVQPPVLKVIGLLDRNAGVDAVGGPAKGAVTDADVIDDTAIGRQQERLAICGKTVGFGRQASETGMRDGPGDRNGHKVGVIGVQHLSS